MLLLPLAALLAIVPLLLHGPSCGHDQGFHLVSWLDAAAQLRHGHYPLWAIAPAWNAGEPRFLFYPPLSWLLGALLTIVLPANATPIIYIFLVLTAAGIAMHRLASEFTGPAAALLASAFYLANPYMLFNAFERSAFAELLAAVWIPLLLLAILRPKPTVRGIAIPLALLWLTNAPAAVMGSYMLALLATLRVIHALALAVRHKNSRQPSLPPTPYSLFPASLALTAIAGTILGLALPAFYLLPAAIQHRNIQVEMAIIPNMRFQDNFLFDYTADPGHNAVNHNISLLAVGVLSLTIAVIAALLLSRKPDRTTAASNTILPIVLLTACITLLLFPISTPIWNHLPEFAFLQFPWRLLTLLSTVLALALALLIQRLATNPGAPHLDSEMWAFRTTSILTLLAPLALGFLLYAHTAQGCELRDLPTSIASSLATSHGVSPTDEYTPNNADNDLVRTDNPGYWLAAHPSDPAPNTVPTPTELNPTANTDDIPIPFAQTLSTPAPHHIHFHTDRPGYLILNLRDYPNWQVSTGCPTCLFFNLLPHIHRDDGLLAIWAPAGTSTIDITWHRTWDQNLGLFLSILALLYLAPFQYITRSRTRSARS